MSKIVEQKKTDGIWYSQPKVLEFPISKPRKAGKTKKPGAIRNFVIGRLRRNNIYVGGSPSNKDLADLINKITGWNVEYKNPKRIIKRFYMDDPPISFHYDLIKSKKTQRKVKAKKKIKLEFCQTNEFLQSVEWRQLRYDALKKNNGCCELCGRSKKDGIILNVDHIKPRKTHPQLALDIENLQVLCGTCNHGKGNRDDTDWR